ncbi:YolD-like family protein [Paenibacillus chitinolyticus]|uniref:YolD-like family protein n=1 Tax=Paenibacillus chitinolyticus TaxID=79263 RepID=UPI00364BFA8B
MGKKLEGNGLYESNRMMLPEHKEAIQRQLRDLNKRTKPALDEQEWELITRAMAYSYTEQQQITMVKFDPFMNIEKTGVITKFDQQLKQVRLDAEGDWEWIKLGDIIKIST